MIIINLTEPTGQLGHK